MIGYHQPNLSTYSTVYVSCLQLDSVIEQLKGQLTCHACGSGKNTSCAHTVVLDFAELIVVVDFFLWKCINVVSFSNFVILWLIDNSHLIC